MNMWATPVRGPISVQNFQRVFVKCPPLQR
jgi:hypothetical protein